MTALRRSGLVTPAKSASPRQTGVLVTLSVLVVLIAGWWLVSVWYQEQLLDEVVSRASIETGLRSNALELAINRRFARLEGLNAFVKSGAPGGLDENSLMTYLATLYGDGQSVASISVAPNGSVKYVYPFSGNERILGYEPLNDTRSVVRNDALRAIRTGEIILSAPGEETNQANAISNQLLAQQSVDINGNFWGLVSMTLDLPSLLAEAQLTNEPGEFTFALRGPDGDVFYGDPQVFLEGPVIRNISLVDGDWQLAAYPTGGWMGAIRRPLGVFLVAGLMIAGLLAGITYLSFNRQERLAFAVKERTSELAEANLALEADIRRRQQIEEALRQSEEQYRSVFESVSDAVMILTNEGKILDANPAAAVMYGYDKEELLNLSLIDLLLPRLSAEINSILKATSAGNEYQQQLVHRHRNNTGFYGETYAAPFMYRGESHVLAVIRDVTEEVRAYQLLERRVRERTQELQTLLEVSRDVASTLDLQPLLNLILTNLQSVVDYSHAALYFIENGQLVLFEQRPTPAEGVSEQQIYRLGDYPSLSALLRNPKPLLFPNLADGTSSKAFIRPAGSTPANSAASAMAVPLMVKDRAVGFLVLTHEKAQYFSNDLANLVMAFASQGAIAIENAQLYEKAQYLAALEERQKLARELHDSVSQALYGIALGARTARTLLEREPEQAKEPVDYVLSLAEAGLAEMRALIFELRPDSIATDGLVSALMRQAAVLQTRHGLEVTTELGTEPDVPLPVKEALYRIAQEASNNVIKHAQATKLTLRLQSLNGRLHLEVSDDGQGFDSGADFPGHLGLKSMQERVARLNGELMIQSAPGAGTQIFASLPV